jgi:hypothetical protein
MLLLDQKLFDQKEPSANTKLTPTPNPKRAYHFTFSTQQRLSKST